MKEDVVSKLNEMNRTEAENKRKRELEYGNQEWEYHGESGQWQWTGDVEPVHIPDDPFPTMTEEEYRLCHEADIQLMEEMTKQRKKEQKEKRQEVKSFHLTFKKCR